MVFPKMSKRLLSKMDHRNVDTEDMRYLVQPRGSGKSWVFRMITPADLVGIPNPWDGRPLGKEIKRGLGTRHLPTARQRRDILLGDIRRLQDGLSVGESFSLASAIEWREAILCARKEAEKAGDPTNVGVEFALTDKLEQAERQGISLDRLKRFSRVATGAGFPLKYAHTQYIEARSKDNPYGYAPLKKTTVINLNTAVKHLRGHLGDETGTACLEDVTPEVARRFRDEYLPSLRSPRSPNGLSAKTIDKNITLLKQLWVWAIEAGHLGPKTKNPWEFTKGLRRAKPQNKQERQDYQPKEFSELLMATKRGTKEGDLLRLAIATGCRVDEIASLKSEHVLENGSGFYISQGKTENAQRFIPVVAEAQDLLLSRLETHKNTGRLFPEWPIRPATGKVAAVSQWFTRFRRKVLGKETDGRLALHSTRHTWRTVARRAGVSETTINELGGWAGPRSSSSVYDHGLLKSQLEEAQRKIWFELKNAGYLKGF